MCVQKKTTSTFGAFSRSAVRNTTGEKISISSVRYPTSPSLQQKTQRIHPTGAHATSSHTKHNNESNKAHSQLATRRLIPKISLCAPVDLVRETIQQERAISFAFIKTDFRRPAEFVAAMARRAPICGCHQVRCKQASYRRGHPAGRCVAIQIAVRWPDSARTRSFSQDRESLCSCLKKMNLQSAFTGTSAQLYMPCSSFVRHDSDGVVAGVAFTGSAFLQVVNRSRWSSTIRTLRRTSSTHGWTACGSPNPCLRGLSLRQ